MNLLNPTVKTSIFYVNDIHAQIPKMERLVSASLNSGINSKNSDADILRLCAGDTFAGDNKINNKAAVEFLDTAKIDAAAMGNHEFDITASMCANLLKNSKTNILSMNMNFPESTMPLRNKVKRSVIIKGSSGEKYGIIGLSPSDMTKRISDENLLEGITIDDKEQTKKELQEEVNKLEKQNINKIFVVSHEGNEFDKEAAQTISGIDVITGGHSHNLIKGIKEGENLFFSPRGEPVAIVQAGRDGNNFGILNLEFNEKGQIISVQNNTGETDNYSPDLIMQKTAGSIFGKSETIGTIQSISDKPCNFMIQENPWGDFTADSMKIQTDSDIALINSNSLRGVPSKGVLTERDVKITMPFKTTLIKAKLTEKDIVEAIKAGGKSLKNTDSKPGIFQVSGLKYTLDNGGELKALAFIDKQGNKKEIDINNPDKNTTYNVVYDEYLHDCGAPFEMLNKSGNDIIQRYNFDKDKTAIDHIKTLKSPVELKSDGRIQIETLPIIS